MPKLAANLTTLFNEVPFLERFARAAEAGFEAVEFLFPYDHAPGDLAALLARHGLEQALFNLPPGDWQAGERGLAAVPGREGAFRASLETALPYTEALGEAIRGYAAKTHAVLLANHGPIVAGTSLEDAVYAMEELEETAKLYLLLHGRNPRWLSEDQIAELQEAFPS